MDSQEMRRKSAAVMGELLLEMNRRETIKKHLGSLDDQAVQTVVRAIADSIELLVERLALENFKKEEKPPAIVEPLHPVVEKPVAAPVRNPAPPPPVPRVIIPAAPPVRPEEEPEERPVFSAPSRERIPTMEEPVPEPPDTGRLHSSEDASVPVRAKIPYTVPDDAVIYIHAAGLLNPDEHSTDMPFMLEEKGIDSRHFAFAWDSRGLRYYLSLLPPDIGTLGRGGTLLLSKKDALRLRGVHENVINDFRLHGMILPFAFGTVAEGWPDLKRTVERESVRVADAVRMVAASKWWTVTVSVLDARFMELQQSDTPEKRRAMDRHRASFSSSGAGGRIDLKTLERILTKQRRLAESIHHELEPLSDRAEIRSIVTLQSGTSDEWKPILKSTYEIRPNIVHRFHRLVTDLQYQHFLQELMISLSGDVEKISLREDHS